MAAEPDGWVVDASVAFGWFAAVPGSEQTAKLLDAGGTTLLLAPDLVVVELLNTAWKSLLLGAITTEQVQVPAHRAAEPFHRLVPVSGLLARAGHGAGNWITPPMAASLWHWPCRNTPL
jgi:predicted nucleic acid-binding protein